MFRTVNMACRFAVESQVGQNYMVDTLIKRGFVAQQTLTIRRLTEGHDGSYGKSVYSLPRLINEIERNQSSFTREGYVCCDGEKYNGIDSEVHHSWFDDLSKVN